VTLQILAPHQYLNARNQTASNAKVVWAIPFERMRETADAGFEANLNFIPLVRPGS